MAESRKVSESLTETVHMVRPNHLNAAGRLFGGILMQWMDEIAGLVAKRHTRKNVITASVDNLRFLRGAYQKRCSCDHRKGYLCGKYIHGGPGGQLCRRSGCVRTPINRAYFTMVLWMRMISHVRAASYSYHRRRAGGMGEGEASQRGAPDEKRSGNLVNPHFFIFQHSMHHL